MTEIYTVRATTDQLGGIYEAGSGAKLVTGSLSEAKSAATDLQDKGRCGFVQRSGDDANWHPGTGWLTPAGQPA